MKRFFFIILICTQTTLNLFANENEITVVHFKDGSIVEGKLIELVPGKGLEIIDENGDTQYYSLKLIDRIVTESFDNSSPKDTTEAVAYTQTENGTFLVGGELYYTEITGSTINRSYSEFQFDPTVGYFVGDNLLLGIKFKYYSNDFLYTFEDDHFSIGPIFRYYFETGSVKPFFLSSLIYWADDHNYTIELGFGAGLNVAIVKNVAVSPIVQYELIKPEDGSLGDLTRFTLGVGFDIFIY